MPRKRTTRAQTTRAKPKLKETEDEIINGMTAEERKSKLESLIKDFDYNGKYEILNFQFIIAVLQLHCRIRKKQGAAYGIALAVTNYTFYIIIHSHTHVRSLKNQVKIN